MFYHRGQRAGHVHKGQSSELRRSVMLPTRQGKGEPRPKTPGIISTHVHL